MRERVDNRPTIRAEDISRNRLNTLPCDEPRILTLDRCFCELLEDRIELLQVDDRCTQDLLVLRDRGTKAATVSKRGSSLMNILRHEQQHEVKGIEAR